MTAETARPALAATARGVIDRIRDMVLGTIVQDGCTRTSPVYFVPHKYRDLDWVSSLASHHSHNLGRHDRVSAVIFGSAVLSGPDQQAVYVTGTAREISPRTPTPSVPTRAWRPGLHHRGADWRGGPPAVGALHEPLGGARQRCASDPRQRDRPAYVGRPDPTRPDPTG